MEVHALPVLENLVDQRKGADAHSRFRQYCQGTGPNSEKTNNCLKSLLHEHLPTRDAEALHGVFLRLGIQTCSELLTQTTSVGERKQLDHNLQVESDLLNKPAPTMTAVDLRKLVHDHRLEFGSFSPPFTVCPMLFTAPHSLFLVRDGHPVHAPEGFTADLARDFACSVGAKYLTWAPHEELRNQELFESSGCPDSTNQDPNFTHYLDLAESPWTRHLRRVRDSFGSPTHPCLLVDLHGCKDPIAPGAGYHLIVGLRAMDLAARDDLDEFRTQLGTILPVVLKGFAINMRPVTKNTGACFDEDRRTLSQQSLSEEGGRWSHAVQFEMCTSFRTELMDDAELRSCMVEGVKLAWQVTLASEGKYPTTVVPPVSKLLAMVATLTQRAKELHTRRANNKSA